MRNMARLPFARELHRQGFTRDGSGKDPLFYVKQVGDRMLDLQLWKDGLYRVSHFLNGRMCTYPSEFTDVDGMKRAIEHELSRADHPPIEPA